MDGKGGASTLAGFFTHVCKLIKKNLDSYTVVDKRTPLPEIDWDMVKRLGPRDYQIEPLVDALEICKENNGAIVASGGFGKTYMQAFMYGAWNNLNTIVTVPLRSIFEQTYKKFKTLFPTKHVGCCGDGCRDISTDVTIATFSSLKNCSLEKCQLLIVDEIQQATGPVMQDIIKSMNPIRIFGYTATNRNLGNGADKLLIGLFGPPLIDISYFESEDVGAVVPCTVYFVKVPAEGPQFKYSNLDTIKRHAIERYTPRNRLIGSIVRAIPCKWQSLIFVEHVVDHLIPLMPFMPQGTKYIHRTSSKDQAGAYALTKKTQDKVMQDYMANKFRHLIATDCLKAGADVPNIRVVVQASSGSSEVEILQEAFRGSRTLTTEYQDRLGVDPKTHFVLIDFLDNHQEAMSKMAEKRMEIYRKKGWSINVVDSVEQIDWYKYEGTKKTT